MAGMSCDNPPNHFGNSNRSSDSGKIIEMSGYANNGSIFCGLATHNMLLASALIYDVDGDDCCKPVLEIPFQKILRCARTIRNPRGFWLPISYLLDHNRA